MWPAQDGPPRDPWRVRTLVRYRHGCQRPPLSSASTPPGGWRRCAAPAALGERAGRGDRPRRTARHGPELPAAGVRDLDRWRASTAASCASRRSSTWPGRCAVSCAASTVWAEPRTAIWRSLLPGADGPRGEIVARRALERLRTIKVEVGGQRLPLQISMGLAAWREGWTAEDARGSGARGAAHASTATRLPTRPDARGGARDGSRGRVATRADTVPRSIRHPGRARAGNNLRPVLSGSELWLLRLMADRGLALLDASALLVVIEERGELRVAASSGAASVRLRITPVQGSALGALYQQGRAVALDRPRGPEAAWLHELGLEARAVLVEPLSMEGQGGGLVIALREQGELPRPRPPGAERVRVERVPAPGGGALCGDRTAALRHGGARARAHALGAGDPRREHPGHRRAAPAARQRARPARQAGAERGGGRGARGARHGDRRPAPPDHRAAPRGARRPRAGGGAGGARQARPGDRRAGREDRDRARRRRVAGAAEHRPRTAHGAWMPSSRAPSTASSRRRSRTSAATRRRAER